MEIINLIAQFLNKLFSWWFQVMPWEQAIFVRAGKRTKLLGAGFYFRIPFLDSVFVQTTRSRTINMPVQDMTTTDGKTVTIQTSVRYSISDMERLYKTLYHPEITLGSIVMSHITDFVIRRKLLECDPVLIQNYANENVKREDFGLCDVHVTIVTFAVVRTFRMINSDQGRMWEGLEMEPKK